MAAYREMAKEIESCLSSYYKGNIASSSVQNSSIPARPVTLNLSKSPQCKETLEHRLAMESDSETESERKLWSPLKVRYWINSRI